MTSPSFHFLFRTSTAHKALNSGGGEVLSVLSVPMRHSEITEWPSIELDIAGVRGKFHISLYPSNALHDT
jgi:hypothetical protein